MDINDIRKIYGTRAPGVIGEHRYYSVLVPFCMVREDLSLLYEVRSRSVSQPGEVCFPGGHVEEGETPRDCAVRETCEELGVTPEAIKIIGEGDTLYGNGNFTLYTFIGELCPDKTEAGSSSKNDFISMLNPDPEEVAEVFTIPVNTLMENKPSHYGEKMNAVVEPDFPYEKVGISRDYPWKTPANDIPVYDIEGKIIWGLTGRITEKVIDTISR